MTATRRQIVRIHTTLGRLRVTDHARKLAVVSAIIWRRIDSTSLLSFDEAHVVINTLDEVTKHPNPDARLAEIVAAAGVLS